MSEAHYTPACAHVTTSQFNNSIKMSSEENKLKVCVPGNELRCLSGEKVRADRICILHSIMYTNTHTNGHTLTHTAGNLQEMRRRTCVERPCLQKRPVGLESDRVCMREQEMNWSAKLIYLQRLFAPASSLGSRVSHQHTGAALTNVPLD